MTPADLDLIAGWVALVLTLMVFSYLLGDNVLYRIAIHVLVGVSAAYIVIVAVESVLIPWVDDTILIDADATDEATGTALRAIGVIPLLIGTLLLFKWSERYSHLGNPSLALIIGVGTAVALVGAVAGTVAPLVAEVGDAIERDAVEGAVTLLGVIATLLYFQYLAVERQGEVRRTRAVQFFGAIGRFFVSVTLGAIYAGTIIASLSVFGDVIRAQLQFILDRVGG